MEPSYGPSATALCQRWPPCFESFTRRTQFFMVIQDSEFMYKMTTRVPQTAQLPQQWKCEFCLTIKLQFPGMKCEMVAICVWNAHLELPPSRIRDGGIDTWAPRPMLYYLCHGLQRASAKCCLWCRPHSWSFHPHSGSSARRRGGLAWLRLFHLSNPAPKIQVGTSKLTDLID